MSGRKQKAELKIAEILTFSRSDRLKLYLSATLTKLAPLAIPILVHFCLDSIVKKQSINFGGMAVGSEALLIAAAIALALIAGIRVAGQYLFQVTASRVGHSLVARFRCAVFEHIVRMPMSYVRRRGVGRVLLRFIGDSDALRNWFSKLRPNRDVEICLTIPVIAYLFLINWKLALVFVVWLPVLYLLVRKQLRNLHETTRIARSKQATFTGLIESFLGKIRYAKVMDSQTGSRQYLRRKSEDIAGRNFHRDRVSARITILCQMIMVLAFPSVLYVGIRLIWSGELGYTALVSFLWLAYALAHNLYQIAISRDSEIRALVSVQRLRAILERSSESGRTTETELPTDLPPTLEIESLQSGGRKYDFILSGYGLHSIPTGVDIDEFTDSLLGFQKPAGTIRLNGIEIRQYGVKQIRRFIYRISPSPLIIGGTFWENVQLFAPRRSRSLVLKEARAELESTGLDLESLFDMKVEPYGENMSDLEIWWLELVRVIATRAQIVLQELPQDGFAARYEIGRMLSTMAQGRMILLWEKNAPNYRAQPTELPVDLENPPDFPYSP